MGRLFRTAVELPPHAPLYIRVRTHVASAEAPCRDCDR